MEIQVVEHRLGCEPPLHPLVIAEEARARREGGTVPARDVEQVFDREAIDRQKELAALGKSEG